MNVPNATRKVRSPSGSFAIGLFGTLPFARRQHPAVRHGGLEWRLHNISRLQLAKARPDARGAFARAAVNVTVSVILCVGAVTVGHVVAAHLNDGATQIAQIAIGEEG
jgi:CrcB protein